jgi:hypothetical protein
MKVLLLLCFISVAFCDMECTRYTCETSDFPVEQGSCAMYVVGPASTGDTVYLSKKSCRDGSACSPLTVNHHNVDAECAPIPRPLKNQSLVNEPCKIAEFDCLMGWDLPSDVKFAPTCSYGKCANFIASGGKCTLP